MGPVQAAAVGPLETAILSSLFVLLGAALAGNLRESARRMADWANQLDDRWYFLFGKLVSLGRLRFYGFTMFCIGAGWIVGGIVQ